MVRTKQYEKDLYNKHFQEQIKRYLAETSKIVYDYWDEKLISMLEISKNDTVLEYGCGIGTISNKISSRLVVGIDISKNLLKIARKAGSYSYFVVADGEKLPFKKRVFDKIIGRGIVHHLSNPEKGVKEINAVLKEDGKMVFSEPNNMSPLIRFIRKFLKIFKHEYSKEQIYFGPDYLKRLFDNPKILFFGYFSYPFGFPDIFPLKISGTLIRMLIKIDKIISYIPFINTLSWHIIIEK